MEHLPNLLKKKLSHPRFREARMFGEIKKAGEKFFYERGLPASIIEFDSKSALLTIKSSHPSVSRELLGYLYLLNQAFEHAGLPKIERMRIIIGS